MTVDVSSINHKPSTINLFEVRISDFTPVILDQFKLDGRVAVVTGARRGLGQAMALGLAQAGADIVCVTRSGTSAETRQLVTDVDRKFWDFACDLSIPGERVGLIDRAAEAAGRIDILINNAGSADRAPPESMPLERYMRMMEVHLNAAFDLSQQVAPHMFRRGRGKIINIGSVMSFEGGLNIASYAAAKHGIAGLTKSLAVSWSRRGINVNCICPGYFETDMSGTLQDDPVRGPQLMDRIPCGRWAQPEEIAGLAVFLASNASNYMHGSLVPIDGGWLAR